MSRYEWERGEIVIPSKEWAGFKQRIRDALNKAQVNRLAIAEEIHAHLVANAKGKKGFDLWHAGHDYAATKTSGSYYSAPQWDSADVQAAISAIVVTKHGSSGMRTHLVKPKKKSFAPYGNTTTEFHDEDCSLVLDNGSRTATWTVHENNHACESARRTALGRAFFDALKPISWTRGSGGEIVGNDEYNQDSRDAGGGANYVTAVIGPKAEPMCGPRRDVWGVSISFQSGPRRRF